MYYSYTSHFCLPYRSYLATDGSLKIDPHEPCMAILVAMDGPAGPSMTATDGPTGSSTMP